MKANLRDFLHSSLGLSECKVFDDKQLQLIERENALALFPKFKN
jgi:hypothetical protein